MIDKKDVFIIAELSANHGGNITTALETVRAAKRAGADAIKLQTYTADTITLDSNKDDFLIKASSPNAKSVMIHETQRMGNMTHMKHHSNGTKIPANNSVLFQPGSFHIMLSSIDKNLKLGDKILINLIFQNHENISIEPILKIKPPIK